jgi:autotransporter-associated beta strand protein
LVHKKGGSIHSAAFSHCESLISFFSTISKMESFAMKNLLRAFLRVSIPMEAVLFLSLGVASLSADSIDWRNFSGNWTTPAKQQMGGSCWAYDPTSSVESRYMMTRNDASFVPDFSEQQLLWETSPDLGSLGGGNGFELLFQYYIDHGVVSETECPEQSTDVGAPPYWPLASGWQNRVFKSTSYTKIWNNNNAAYLKNLLKTSGPFLAGINGSNWYDSVQQIRDHYLEKEYGDNHSIEVVGFQDDATCPTGGYWICKNSWGTGRGDNGTGYMPYGTLEITDHLYTQTGPVYYSGPMYHVGGVGGTDYTGTAATKTWTGTTGATWDTTSGNSGNWSGNFQWVNHEVQAVFDATGTNKAIIVKGPVIAHGLTVNTSGYSFAPYDSNSSLTITSGGINTTNSLTLSSQVYIGGPQTWNVPTGQTITVSGALHTVISNLTVAGAGNVTISGPINGGGVMNSDGPATGHGSTKPGGIIKTNTGSLTLSGASNFGGDITVSTGTLTISPAANATYSGAFMGSGTLSLAPTSAATISIGGGNSNFTGPISLGTNATLGFIPATGAIGSFTGAITGTSRPVVHNGPGTTILTNVSGRNTYSGTTTLSSGVLQADSGFGLPSASRLILSGGVLQGNGTSAVTFTRTLSNATGSNRFYWASGGGFSANSYAMNVRINNSTNTISFGSSQGSQIVGELKLSSNTAANVTAFMNGLNLNGSNRTISVDDNPATTADFAVLSNVINNTTGTAGFYKYGAGLLRLTAANTYNGPTNIGDGVLQADLIGFDGKTTGIPAAGNLQLFGTGVFMPYTTTATFTRAMGTGGGQVQLNGGGFAANASNYNVNIGGNATPTPLAFGATAGTNITGSRLIFNAPTSTGTLNFLNGLNLAGGTREIQVNGSTANLSGAIIGAVGSGLQKTGIGKLTLSGTAANTYSGTTTLVAGNMDLNKSANIVALPGDLVFANTDRNVCIVRTLAAGQISPSAKLIWNFNTSTNNFGAVELMGNNLTVAGISDSWVTGIIENTEAETGYGNSTLTVNNADNCSYYGFIRDHSTGGSGTLGLTKQGAGTLTLVGTAICNWSNISYTGPTLISAGKLVIQDGVNLFGSAITNNSELEMRAITTDFTFSQPIGGNGNFTKTGQQKLWIAGSSPNTYIGSTTISEGMIVLNKSAGVYSIPGDVTISAAPNTISWLVLYADGQMPTTANVNFQSSSNGYAVYMLNGHNAQVAGISDTYGNAVIENTQNTPAVNCAFTLNNSTDCTYNGYIRDTYDGSGTLAFVKSGTGTLTIGGTGAISHTGGTTFSAGTVYLQKTSGVAVPGPLTISAASNTITWVVTNADNQLAASTTVDFQGSSLGYPVLLLNGHSATVAGISDSYGTGVIENTQDSYAGACLFTVNNSSNCTYNGYIRDSFTGTGTLGFNKTGWGTLTLGGTGVISHTGGTSVSCGMLYLEKTSGVAIPGALNISAPNGDTFVCVTGSTQQFSSTATINFLGGNWPVLVLGGHNATVASISDTYGTGVIENTQDTSAGTATLTVSSGDFNGYMRNTSTGSGLLAVVKNGTGTLYLRGNNANDFTGGLTINAGIVDFENTENDVAHPYTVNAGGHLVLNGTQLAAAASAMSLIAASETEDYANSVPDTNNGTMSIVGSTYFNARNLVGTGTLMVKDDAVVYAHSLVQDTLIIGGTSSYSPAVAVPEPGTMMLLAFGALATAGIYFRRR